VSGIAIILLLTAIWLMNEVRSGATQAFDEYLLRALRDPADGADPIGPAWLEMMFSDITTLGGTTVLILITLLAIFYLVMDSKHHAALFVLVSIGGGQLLSMTLKNAVGRPRPDLVAHLVEVQTASFPSGHAMLSAVSYLTLGALLARVQPRLRLKAFLLAVAVLLTLLVGASRVYLGVHWPTDVLAGWCFGAGWALLCWVVALRLQQRGAIEKDN
jgi:undecaprenyl-diphosphatase